MTFNVDEKTYYFVDAHGHEPVAQKLISVGVDWFGRSFALNPEENIVWGLADSIVVLAAPGPLNPAAD